MKNNYIPDIFKEKIIISLKYLYALFLFVISILFAIALLTFDVNDNSFLTSTSAETQNLLGNFGSYLASFILYLWHTWVFSNFIFLNLFFINKPWKVS